jgi:16S rRNA (uracil1498-N3)-methyltransferase
MLPRFFAPDAESGASFVTLPLDESHHLRHVLRLGAGAAVLVFDGRGHEWAGRVRAVMPRAATVDLLQPTTPPAEPPVRLTLGVALLKGDQMDAVVRDATTMGAAVIAPMVTSRVVVPARAWQSGRAADRWRRVAVAAAKQCGRAVVPEIAEVQPFADVVAAAGAALAIIAVEPAAGASLTPLPDGIPAAALALVGPEGGWAPEEVERAIAGGARPMSLGPRILRAESAPIVLLSSLWTRWGW